MFTPESGLQERPHKEAHPVKPRLLSHLDGSPLENNSEHRFWNTLYLTPRRLENEKQDLSIQQRPGSNVGENVLISQCFDDQYMQMEWQLEYSME